MFLEIKPAILIYFMLKNKKCFLKIKKLSIMVKDIKYLLIF